MARHADAQMRQCSDIWACSPHSAAQASPMATHAVIIARITTMSSPPGRIIIRIVAVATSAVFMHIEAHRAMPSPLSASAHIVAAIDAAEHASMHCCRIGRSMPAVAGIGMDLIMSAIMLIAARPPSCPGATWSRRRYAWVDPRRHGRTRPGPWGTMEP